MESMCARHDARGQKQEAKQSKAKQPEAHAVTG